MSKYLCLECFQGKHIQSATQFTREQTEALLDLACEIKQADEAGKTFDTLKGKTLVPLFFEHSTRTFSSFSAAMLKLGGNVCPLSVESSSVAKGETLHDTVRTVDCYADAICLRHPKQEALLQACSVASHPVLNCGNGVGEHPTQSLLDMLTIRSELGTLDGLTIALVGDLKHGRTVHSLSKLLTNFKVKKIYMIAPKVLAMPQDVVDYVVCKGVAVVIAESPTADILKEIDVLYVTRIQKERFINMEDYDAIKGSYVIDKSVMAKMKKRMIVLHPLPRIDEITTEVDSDPRAAYFRQMKYGMYLRMALFVTIFGKTKEFGGPTTCSFVSKL